MKNKEFRHIALEEKVEVSPWEQRLGKDLRLGDEQTARLFYEVTGLSSAYRQQEFIIELMTQGEYEFDLNERRYRVRAPFLVVRLPESSWWPVRVPPDARLRNFIVSAGFMDEVLRECRGKGEVLDAFFHCPVVDGLAEEDVAAFVRYYDMLKEELRLEGNPGRRAAVRHLLAGWLDGHAAGLSRRGREQTPLMPWKMKVAEDFKRLAKVHYKAHRDVLFYAGRMKMKPDYLSKLMKEVTGRTAKELLEGYVISDLKVQLRHTSKTLEALSVEFHFVNTDVMSKFFKRLTRLSLRDYQQGKIYDPVSGRAMFERDVEWRKRG